MYTESPSPVDMSTMPKDPRDPFVRAAPSLTADRQAEAEMLRARANFMDDVGPDADPAVALRTFTHPTWRELQAEERSVADMVAEQIARAMFGVSTTDRLTPKQANDIEAAALYAVRRPTPEWVRAAHVQATDTLVAAFADEFGALFAQLPPERRRMVAMRVVTTVWSAFIGTLEGSTPLKPAIYLRIHAAKTIEGSR